MDGTAALVMPPGGLAEHQPWTPGLFDDPLPQDPARQRRARSRRPEPLTVPSDAICPPGPAPTPLRRGRWPQTRSNPPATTDRVAPVQTTRCQSVLRAHDGRDLSGAMSVNPYLGCALACQFCPAAVTAPGPGCNGRDGEGHVTGTGGSGDAAIGPVPPIAPSPVVLAKVNIAERLREELRRPGYRPRPLALGSAAELYQDAERELGLTRAVLELLLEAGHPVTLRSRSPALLRDLDLLAALAERELVAVSISLCSLDAAVWPGFEGRCTAPAQRLQAMRRLARAGVPVGLWLGPLLPAEQDPQREALFAAAQEAGASFVHWTPDLSQEDSLDALAQRFGLARRWPELDRSHFHPPATLHPAEAGRPRQAALF